MHSSSGNGHRLGDLLQNAAMNAADAQILAAGILRKDRAWIFAHSEAILSQSDVKQLASAFQRRGEGESVAAILGEREFFGRMFAVGQGEFVPRPCTEELMHEVLSLYKNFDQLVLESWVSRSIDAGIAVASLRKSETLPLCFVDVGTGSGCIAVTMLKELPESTCIATDIRSEALASVRHNAARHQVADRLQCVLCDGADIIVRMQTPFVLVSNPPYIPERNPVEPGVQAHEPTQALFAGQDGMAVLRPLLHAAVRSPYCSGIVVECLESQVELLPTADRPT